MMHTNGYAIATHVDNRCDKRILSDVLDHDPTQVLGLAAAIERECMAMRTREALAKRHADGKPLGRFALGPAQRLTLDAQEAVIRGSLAKGINTLAIATLVECAPSTLYAWLARCNLRPSRGAARVQDTSVTRCMGGRCGVGEQ